MKLTLTVAKTKQQIPASKNKKSKKDKKANNEMTEPLLEEWLS